MYYPLETVAERLIYMALTYRTVICADYDSSADKIAPVEIPKLTGHMLSIWGVNVSGENIKIFNNKNLKKNILNHNCIIMNITCREWFI